jgi:hypothetical protein
MEKIVCILAQLIKNVVVAGRFVDGIQQVTVKNWKGKGMGRERILLKLFSILIY